ncbi:MAG: carboxypeptidase-like regulatory domain-containing protein [Chitinophagaceae bacterium]|nr:carboxypeptidase-like regulatory domain-containing protein [Chitinophagaceae bacterium]
MKKKIIYNIGAIVFGLFFITKTSAQQFDSRQLRPKDSTVIQLFGIMMTADSLRGIPGGTVVVVGKGRGTISNDNGIFSIAVLKGDKIRFSSVGFKDKEVEIPASLKGNQFSIIQLMVNDTVYLPATIIQARPSAAQLEREFLSMNIPNDAQEIARQNLSATRLRVLMAALPIDGREAYSRQMRQQASQAYYKGQLPPMNILNPAAWEDFVDAWKRGDFKSK